MSKFKINILLFMLISTTAFAQNKVSINVDGACSMCATRIEEAALKFVFIESAKWDKNTKQLSLIINNSSKNNTADIDNVAKQIASIGHDTDKYKADDETYENLPGCCHYREEEVDEHAGHDHAKKPKFDHDDHTGHIHGQIWEIYNGKKQPLAGTNIFWKDSEEGIVSFKDGTFSIPRVNDSDKLIISFVGYDAKIVEPGDKDFIEVTFSENQLLDEIVVTYRKNPTSVSFLSTLKVQNISEGELKKAACCNLSESFETNPSVDVTSTDAVSGTKQIEMLGLAGGYVQITRENMPETRGLSTLFGLTYTPGPWIESIQLNMGAGSVVNGFESITGQINTELRKPDSGEKLGLNAYANAMGRIEGNANMRTNINDNVSTSLLLHANTRKFKWDKNSDGFLDSPIGDQFIALNRYKFSGENGWEGQFGIKGMYLDQKSGQEKYFDNNDANTYWHSAIKTKRIDSWLKIGRVINDNSSFGMQFSGVLHNQESNFGKRNYDADQYSFYSNFIYQYSLDDKNELKVGASFMHDTFNENFENNEYLRNENVVGVFTEYTYKPSDSFTTIVGLRVDNHNNFGTFVTPRLHIRYAFSEKSVLRASVGRGQKTASIFAENIGAMSSSRKFIINSNNNDNPYGLDAEIAWIYGLNYSKGFSINERDLTLNLDYFYTDFQNQIVVDFENTREVSFYNLNGKSYSHSIQVQADWEVFDRFTTRVAYRFNKVMTDYSTGLEQKPMVAPHRTFINLSYATLNKWSFDITTSWQSSKRIPSTKVNPVEYRASNTSPSFFMTNIQVSKSWFDEKLEVYSGVENLFDFRQDNPIIASDDPFGQYFDASMIWGPVFGRNIYAGVRYSIE